MEPLDEIAARLKTPTVIDTAPRLLAEARRRLHELSLTI